MRAAVVTTFTAPPAYTEFPLPSTLGPHEAVVDVLAVGLHPRVRSQADGSHYTSTDTLPLVPGIDGVGRMADGTLRYFVTVDSTLGSLAEQTVIDLRRSIPLPPGADPVQIAAAMNPAMSSWVALRCRTRLQPGQSVLVLGATGSAGRLALQVARELGAGRVVAVGRDADRLAALGADAWVALDASPQAVTEQLAVVGSDVDVVLDYLWGGPAATVLSAIVHDRADDDRQLTWIQVGSAAGAESTIHSDVLRSTRLQIVGSGQGSVNVRDMAAELPALTVAVAQDRFALNPRTVALADVESAWTEREDSARRVVVLPQR